MGYKSNLLFCIAKSISERTPDLIKHDEKQDKLREIRKYKKDYPDWQLDDEVAKLLEQEAAGFYPLVAHYKKALPSATAHKLDPKSSRLVIIGHGLENSVKTIAQDNGDKDKLTEIDAATLAQWTKTLLNGQRVNRISLHVCYAGGGNPNVLGTPAPFGLAFARRCGELADTVSARKGTITMNTLGQREVEGQYRAEGLKVIYTTGADAAATVYDYADKIARDAKIDKAVLEGFERSLDD